MVAVGSRDRPNIGKFIQGWPPVESSLKGAISRHIRKEEMRNGEVSRGRQDSRIREKGDRYSLHLAASSGGQRDSQSWALQSNHQASGSHTCGCAGRGREDEGSRTATEDKELC